MKKRVVPSMKTAPVFAYTSVCCGEIAQKPPLLASPDADGTLGSWVCPKCRRPCKVSRHKNSVDKENQNS